MTDFFSLLLEAQDPNIDSDKLWEIKGSDLSNFDHAYRSELISTLVDHPNSDEDMCLELFREWPNETLACSRFQLLLLSDSEIPWDDIFENIFEEFSEVIPALAALARTPKLHKPTIRLFESELLRRLDGLSCSFEWIMSCTHEVSIDWDPGLNKEVDADEDGELTQDFSIACSATIEDGNYATLRSPSSIDNIHSLFIQLDSQESACKILDILKKHGWDCEDDTTGDGGYYDLDSVEPVLDGWDFSASLMGDASGTLCITDPSGVEHEYELPAGDIEDSFANYALDDCPSLLDIFANDAEGLNAFRKIVCSII